MTDDAVIPVPAKLLTRLAQIDTDQLGAQIDSDDSHADEMYQDIDAINAVAEYAEVEIA